MINKTVLVGRLTKDVELRKTQSGKSVASFTIAVNRPFGKEETDFINCVAWNNTADFMANYLSKGALIGVDGRTQTRNYEDKDGKRVYVQEVVCDSVQSLGGKQDKRQDVQEDEPVADITSDDLPF